MHREVALQGETGDLLWLPMEPELDVGREMRDHLGIATAVANEDAERARLLAEEHVQSNFRRLTELHHALLVTGD